MIEIKRLKELIKLMKDNELSEIDLRDGEETITLKRPVQTSGSANVPMAPHIAHEAPHSAVVHDQAASATHVKSAQDYSLETIESPMVGTFYSASDPDSDAFVKVGDHVSHDTVVCLIEAMKVYSEVKAEKTGVIEQILVKNADSVEFGQPLFKIRAGE